METSAICEVTDWDPVLALFQRNGWQRTPVELEWQYNANPVGRVWIEVANGKSGDLAAFYAALPGRFWMFGEHVQGLQSLDTITDADFRGRGLFGTLAQSLYERAAESEVSLVYGFPNQHSAPGFFGKLDWTMLDPVPFLLRPINLNFALPKRWRHLGFLPSIGAVGLVNSFSVKKAELEDVDVESIWVGFQRCFNIGLKRDTEYFRWRLSKPGQSYQILQVAGRGFVVFNIMEKHGGKIAYIVELMTSKGGEDLELAHELLTAAIEKVAAAGADVVLAWHFAHSPYFLAYLAAGFLPLPEQLRPIQLHFGARGLADSRPIVRQDWYLSYCDSDTV